MAEAPDLNGTIDASLGSILPVLADIPHVAETWSEWNEHSQLRFYLEWDELMDRLEFLAEAFSTRQMTPDQASTYGRIIATLNEVAPLLVRLELQHPRLAPPSPVESRQR